MNVTRYQDARAFYGGVERYLSAREAEHNLTLGLLSNVVQNPTRFPEPLLVVVEDESAVQLVALRTDIQYALILSLAVSPEAVTALANDLHENGVTLNEISGPKDESKIFAESWARVSGQPAHEVRSMRAFKLEKVIRPQGVSGYARRGTVADRDKLIEWDMAFRREAFPNETHTLDDVKAYVDLVLGFRERGVYVWDDGGAVSYACYSGPTPHAIRIGPVYTPPAQRGHGYASACVADMSRILLDGGRQFCFLFTNLANPTANHIYQVIGYEAVCDFTVYGFSKQP